MNNRMNERTYEQKKYIAHKKMIFRGIPGIRMK